MIRRSFKAQLSKHGNEALAYSSAFAATIGSPLAHRLQRYNNDSDKMAMNLDLAGFVALYLSYRVKRPDLLPYAELRCDSAELASLLNHDGKAMLLSVHNGFAFSAAMLMSRIPVMSVAFDQTVAEKVIRRSGGRHFENLQLLFPDEYVLAKFIRSKDHAVLTVQVDYSAGPFLHFDTIHLKTFTAAARYGITLFFAHYSFDSDGGVSATLSGPHLPDDPADLQSRFIAFCGNGYAAGN